MEKRTQRMFRAAEAPRIERGIKFPYWSLIFLSVGVACSLAGFITQEETGLLGFGLAITIAWLVFPAWYAIRIVRSRGKAPRGLESTTSGIDWNRTV